MGPSLLVRKKKDCGGAKNFGERIHRALTIAARPSSVT
jgi:hypothetical protein